MNVWTKECPKEPGDYLFMCEEAGGFPSIVPVWWHGDQLWVTCQDTGAHEAQVYHNNLINPRWLRLHWKQVESVEKAVVLLSGLVAGNMVPYRCREWRKTPTGWVSG